MNTSRNITDFPLEVLGLIFEELPSLGDRLCLAQVHPQIGLAFSCHYGNSFKNLNVTTNKMWSALLPLCGSRVEHINGDWLNATMLKLVELHCPNLQSIGIHIVKGNFNSLKSFLANVRSLRSMSLVDMEKHSGIVESLKFQPSLRRLLLKSFTGDEVLEVRNLFNLEELILDCSSENNVNIHELCHRLKKLRALTIRSYDATVPNEVDGVPCPALKELYLIDCRWTHFKPRTPAILNWILSHAERLEILMLDISIMHFKPEIVIYQILSQCKNLRSLCKRMDKVDTDFAHRVFKIVSENGVTSEERPLDLNFSNRNIHIDIQQVMANTSAKQLITFKSDRCYKKMFRLKRIE